MFIGKISGLGKDEQIKRKMKRKDKKKKYKKNNRKNEKTRFSKIIRDKVRKNEK